MKSKIKKASKNFLCLVTCPGLPMARKMAKSILEKKLCACVNLIKGIESHYRWNGKLCKDSEILMIIKGNFRNQKELARTIINLHSYEVPEIIFIQLDSGSSRYIDWINSNVA